VHPGETVADVDEATGFELDLAAAGETPPPSEAELAALHEVDPHRLRELEFKDLRAAADTRLRELRATERSHRA
jgi:hypothetical protein